MVRVVAENLSKSYSRNDRTHRSRVQVLENLNLSVEKGEFVTLFGANGCGKTTLLKIIAGLETFDTGKLEMNGRALGEVNTGFIFQNYMDSLLPWRRVIDNIALPLCLRGLEKKEARVKVEALLGNLKIELPLNAFPYQLSAGQQQMVAIARALAHKAEILLLDEPFSSLDFQARISIQQELLRIWRNTRMSVLFVSHEIEEAIFLADRLILLAGHPAKVKEVIEISLPRPRNHQLLDSSDFVRLRAEVTKSFLESL